MSQQFDEFSKSLSEPVPRRESLRRLGAVFAGALLGSVGLKTAWGGPKSDPCNTFCRCSNKKQQSQCVAACRECNHDPSRVCGSCGNFACCSNGGTCCDYCCTDLDSDVYNCGDCGYVCDPPGPYEYGACIDGRCEYVCAEGAGFCNGTCTPLDWDPDNCGECGYVCGGSTPYCNRGICSPCAPGTAMCEGRCISFQWDNVNCGACGVVCPYDTYCLGGYCEPQELYWGD